MIKKRLIPVLFFKNGFFIRSENFNNHKIIGNVVNIVRRFNEWDIDELIVIDISNNNSYSTLRNDHKIPLINNLDDALKLISKECFMPLTFGGAIKKKKQAKHLFKNGADKILINSLFYSNPKIIKNITDEFGKQAVVLSLDYMWKNNTPLFYHSYGKIKSNLKLDEIKRRIEWCNIGEILLHNIQNDGSGNGYDIDSITYLSNHFQIPTICCGGAIDFLDFYDVVTATPKLSGIAAGNMFHFKENIYPKSKNFLKTKNLMFR